MEAPPLSTANLTEAGGCQEVSDRDGVTALQEAAAHGDERAVDLILQGGTSSVDTANKLGWTPLMQAARNGHSTVVEKLIAVGANICLTNRYGANLLSLAAASNDQSTILAVIHAISKQVNIIPGNSALLIASLFGNLSTVQLLLSCNCSPNVPSDPLGLTPLMMAAVIGNYALAYILINFGANTNILNYANQTALDIAYLKDHTNIITLLSDQCDPSVSKWLTTEDQTLDSSSTNPDMCHFGDSPFKRNSNTVPSQSLTPKNILGDRYWPGKIKMQELSPMKHVPLYHGNIASPSSCISRSPTSSWHCLSTTPDQNLGRNIPTLPSSPLPKRIHNLGSITSETTSFVLHSPSPSRRRPHTSLNSSSPSPRSNVFDMKYSPMQRRRVYAVNCEKENISCETAAVSPVQSKTVTSSLILSRDNSPRAGAFSQQITQRTLNAKTDTSFKLKTTSFWKRLNNLTSPRRCLSPHKHVDAIPFNQSPRPPLGKLLHVMNLGEYANLFHTHELDTDTFLALDEKDLEEIGIENKTARKDIMNKILQLNLTPTK